MNLYNKNKNTETDTESTTRMRSRARADFLLGLLILLILIFLSFAFEIEFVESVYQFSRAHESWELDELLFSFLWIALIATLYGIRRVQDIKTINREVSYRASHDSLTGLPNRSLAQFQLEKLLQRATRTPISIGVIFLDLDNFKDINDSYGHDTGDVLIQLLGQRLVSVIRHNETVSRLGGDEFLIISEFPQNTTNIEILINRIENCQKEPFEINGRSITTTFSIGVALSPQHGVSVQSLLIAADTAMYEAKKNQSSTACYYTPEIGKKIADRYRLSSTLKQAMLNEQLYLVYQPIVCSNTGVIKGYEALTRWNLEGKFINPEIIISLAEDIGISEDFFKWLLRSSLQDSLTFLQPGQFIALNVTVKQFLDESFLLNTQNAISIHPNILVEFEITESSLLADFHESTRKIDALNKLGINVMIDDFGTGYSSLSRLKHLNVDKIKIDRSFLHDASIDKKSAGIYESIVDLAHKLEIDIVAEGVETVEQMQFLQQFKPIYMQGYLFQKPQINTQQTSASTISRMILPH